MMIETIPVIARFLEVDADGLANSSLRECSSGCHGGER